MPDRSAPTFLVIGAQKSGTTWLHQNLQSHPDIWLPPEKELHFWDARLSSDLSLWDRLNGDGPEAQRWRRQVRRQAKMLRQDRTRWRLAPWYARFFLGGGGVDWYRHLFRAAGPRLSGEITPDYALLDDHVVAQVREAFPELRLVYLVRHPVERLWSHAQMEERLTGRPAHQRVVEMLEGGRPRAHGDYRLVLDRWADVFGPDRIWVGFMEDIAHHPRRVLDAVTDHLGAPRHDRYPKAGRQVHRGGQETMPGTAAARVAEALAADLHEQADRLGGHARWWQWSATTLATDGSDRDVAYPFWTDELADRARVEGAPSPDTWSSGRYDELTTVRR